MANSPAASSLKSLAIQIEQLERDRLYPNSPNAVVWNNLPHQSQKDFVDDVMDTISLLGKSESLDIYGPTVVNGLSSLFQTFISQYASISSIVSSQISSQHHSCLNQLESISDFLRKSGFYTDLKVDIKNESKEIIRAGKFANELLKNENAFNSALPIFQKVLSGKDAFVSSIIGEKGEHFIEAAEQYEFLRAKQLIGKSEGFLSNWYGLRIPLGNIWQMIFSILFAGIILYFVADFIKIADETAKAGKDISVGFALLRISALIVPSYFALFFSRQYITGKKLYQFYKFKSVALTTLASLYTLYGSQQNEIIDKSLTVIFSEFKEKSDGDISQKDLLNILTEVIKK